MLVISYDLLSRKESELLQKDYLVVILDEAHFIKDYKTVREIKTEVNPRLQQCSSSR